MTYEQQLARYISEITYDDLSEENKQVAKRQLLALIGGLISGWNSPGTVEMVDMIKKLGGKDEATILIWNGKVPAQYAAFLNSTMGRALDICDHMSPGLHTGSSVIPAAFAAAELAGGHSGKDVLLAIAVGTEIAIRLNLSEQCFNGFDPTGVVAVLASAAAAAKLMRLNEEQTLNTMALAFNRCGGSFQSNIDGALAVKVIEGWTAQAGLECARLAANNINGPKNFLDGVYGYFHNFGRDQTDKDRAFEGLGETSRCRSISFKKYPSCGMTQGATEVILNLMNEKAFSADEVDQINVFVTPYAAKLAGKPFEPGESPVVDAQYSIAYCVANALLRAPVRLEHFEPTHILDETIMNYIRDHVNVTPDPALDAFGHYTTKISVLLKDGRSFEDSISIIPGIPGNELTPEDFENRFYDCIAFSGRKDMAQRAEEIRHAIEHFEEIARFEDFLLLFSGEEPEANAIK